MKAVATGGAVGAMSSEEQAATSHPVAARIKPRDSVCLREDVMEEYPVGSVAGPGYAQTL